jgi:hypothetical protein
MPVVWKASLAVAIIVLSMTGGYLSRRLGWLKESSARPIMTGVILFGYGPISFLAIWAGQLTREEVFLPILAAAHVLIVIALGAVVARAVTRNRPTVGVFALASGAGNTGVTMGGLLAFILFGEAGLRLASIYCIMWMPAMVFVMYPFARHFSRAGGRMSLGRLMLRSCLDWRSAGVPLAVAAMVLAGCGVKRPEAVRTFHVVDVLILGTTLFAYFSIGLRLHAGRVWRIVRPIAGLQVVRHGVSAGVAAGLALAAPWATGSVIWRVFLLESVMPTAITVVAIANMFHLKPRTASALFVADTVLFLAVGLAIVLWLFGLGM